MRIEIIHLPRDADVPWCLDRLAWCQARYVLLVAPREMPRMHGRLPWVRVARRAKNLGLHVAVVTRNRRLACWVQEAGLMWFPSRRAAEKTRWPSVRARPGRGRVPRGREALRAWWAQVRRVPPRVSARQRGLAFALSLISLLTLAALFVPEAQVTLPVRTQTYTAVLNVWLSPDLPSMDPATLGLPLRAQCVEVDDRFHVPATGTVTVPQAAAQGNLLWRNLTLEPITLPKGLRVQVLHGPAFVLEEGGTLPAGPDSTLLLPARALEPGPVGNVPAGSLWQVPPTLEGRVVVTNPEPMQGGTALHLPTVTEDAVQEAEAARRTHRLQQARAALNDSETEALLFTAAPARVETLVRTVEPPPGEPTLLAQVRLRERWCFWAVPRAAVRALALRHLSLTMPRGFQLLEGTLTTTLDVDQSPDGPPFSGRLHLQATLVPDLNPVAWSWRVALRTPRTVQRLWQQEPHAAAPARIDLRPAGWPWLPAALRIHVDITPQGEGQP